MSCEHVKVDLRQRVESYLSKIQHLPIHQTDKLKIINSYVYSKIKWQMSIYNLGSTWVKQNLDNIIVRQVRHWLNFHPGANIAHLKLPIKKLGLNFLLPSDIFLNCQVTTRQILSSS